MKNYVEKFHPSGGFDKAKTRLLGRGDKQLETAESEAPVARVETIFLMMAIAARDDLEVFKIDFESAFLNTPMPDEVKYKWLYLDKYAAERFVALQPEKFAGFQEPKGSMLVEMKKLGYGWTEASHYWNKVLDRMFTEGGGYKSLSKDRAAYVKRRDNAICMIGVIVDDLNCAATRGSGLKEELLKLCRDTFTSITVEEGDKINFIGMTFSFDRTNKWVDVSQKNYCQKLEMTYKPTSKPRTPASDKLFECDPTSPLLKDQLSYMSIVSAGMYCAKRTQPTALPTATHLATKYWHATEEDLKKAEHFIAYLAANPDHYLRLRSTSNNIVACADASYAEHADAKSHTGGCIGLEYDDKVGYFMFISNKQSIVAKSSCEAELIAQSTIGEHIVWLREVMEELGFVPDKPTVLHQDNKAAIILASKGCGSFKRTKHINVRYFWLKELIDKKLLELLYVPTASMVADILTKPLVGYKFKELQPKIQNWE